jgi:hypothetical protein
MCTGFPLLAWPSRWRCWATPRRRQQVIDRPTGRIAFGRFEPAPGDFSSWTSGVVEVASGAEGCDALVATGMVPAGVWR